MYYLCNTHYVNKGRIVDKTEILSLEGFMMSSKNKIFQVDNVSIRDLCLLNKALAHSVVSKKVLNKYEILISRLTKLLLDEDDSDGECAREALNEIEKFRQEIKNKYRLILQKKELEYMSKKLSILQKEASQRLLEIEKARYEMKNIDKKCR